MQEQIAVAKARLASLPGISMQKRLNFEMSVKMLQRSLSDESVSRRFRAPERAVELPGG